VFSDRSLGAVLDRLKQTILESRLRASALALIHARKKLRVARELFYSQGPGAPRSLIILDHPVTPKPRSSLDNPHPKLYEILNRGRAVYRSRLERFLPYRRDFERIESSYANTNDETEPAWFNGFLPAIDAMSLYSFVVEANPRVIVEVGSGNSTKFMRRAIRDHKLGSSMVAIDPRALAFVDRICDQVIRRPAENVDLAVFDQLQRGDLLFIDSSHRVLQNSDVTVLFLEVIPRLPPGVLVHVHDICLPYDYGSEILDRFYSEQYILAAYLLAEGSHIQVLLPNLFISYDQELKSILNPIWTLPRLRDVDHRGGAFWFETS
jgi:methyltransferase family protein